MELDMREWFLVIGGVMIVGVLAHGAWVFIRNRRDALGVRYEDNIPDIDVDDIDLLRGELPSGGARVIASSSARAELASQQAAAEDTEPVDTAADQAVPVLLDPIDQDVARAAQGGADTPALVEPVAEASSEARPEEEAPVDEAISAEPTAADCMSEAEPAPIEPDEPAADETPAIASVDVSAADAVSEAGTGAKMDDTDESQPPPADFEQAPLFAGEPIVDRAEPRDSGRRKRRPTRSQDKAPPPADPPASEPLGPPEEVIVINVLCRGDDNADGPTLVEAITEQGLRFGDMNIFHRASPTDRARTDFSLASAVEPGTFDLGAMDGFTTRGVTLFMQLPGPAEPIEAFEDMVRIARGIASRIGGDLKDEQHSVMTGQTIEHCRQRVRDFTRRQMSRRV